MKHTFLFVFRIMVLDQGKVAEFNTVKSLLANRKSIFYGMAKDAGLADWDENNGRRNSVKPASSSQDGDDDVAKQDGGDVNKDGGSENVNKDGGDDNVNKDGDDDNVNKDGDDENVNKDGGSDNVNKDGDDEAPSTSVDP